VFVFCVFAVPFLAVRHLLPGVPPLVWLVLRRLDESLSGDRDKWTRGILALTAAVTAVCGFLVAKADYDFAAWYRHVAVNRASRSVAAGRVLGKEIWFTGHWGWSYYGQRVGMRQFLVARPELRDGDFLLLPLIQTWDPVPQELHAHLRRLQIITPTPKRPIETGYEPLDKTADWCLNSVRTISTEVHFYSGGTLNLPWQFSRKPLDDFVVYQFVSEPDEQQRPD
jgi:hypothetical protein